MQFLQQFGQNTQVKLVTIITRLMTVKMQKTMNQPIEASKYCKKVSSLFANLSIAVYNIKIKRFEIIPRS